MSDGVGKTVQAFSQKIFELKLKIRYLILLANQNSSREDTLPTRQPDIEDAVQKRY
jgi:hypothetical protein